MIRSTIQYIYNSTIRPYLPRRLSVYNGVAIWSPHRLFDIGYIPSDSTYEALLLDQLRRVVGPGDSVTIVGGGKGVSTILAAEHTYPDGSVTVIEASRNQVNHIHRVLSLYDFDDRVNVKQGHVGPISNSFGQLGDPDEIKVNNLPETDVLIADCEGGELHLAKHLGNLNTAPQDIIVETHAVFGSPTAEVTKLLEQHDYQVHQVGIVDADRGVAVLHAMQ